MTYPQGSATGADAAADDAPARGARRARASREIEERVLAYWDEPTAPSGPVVEQRDAGEDGANEFVFYDGPPFANGLPHYGHLLTGYVKDLVPRYQTMRGRRVERRFGWDTHGLPAELEAMRQLGIKTTDEILELGIEKFNAACRESVLRVHRRVARLRHPPGALGRLRQRLQDARPRLHGVGASGRSSSSTTRAWSTRASACLPYCWNDETPLSNHELRMDDDVYQIAPGPGRHRRPAAATTGELALVWTTTPWTLPSNLAIMVGPDIDYVVVESDVTGTHRALPPRRGPARGVRHASSGDDDRRARRRAAQGRRPARAHLHAAVLLLPRPRARVPRRARPTSSPPRTAPGWCTPPAPSVRRTRSSPTARASSRSCRSARTAGSPTRSTTTPGMLVFDANLPIIDHLKARDRGATGDDRRRSPPGTVLLRRETYDHSYPHCWRCREPLIYMARLVVVRRRHQDQATGCSSSTSRSAGCPSTSRTASSASGWRTPATGRSRRNRFWGSPIPVWKSRRPGVPADRRLRLARGARARLRRARSTDLHRPFIDELTRPNPDDPTGDSRRCAGSPTCWTAGSSPGSMSFAQVHYPFENADWFEHHFPGDFIVEYIGQTRGWFYTMHVLASALFERPAFETCLSHGIVLGSDGQKMSKSLRNYPDVREVFDRDGADAMRWFLMSSPDPARRQPDRHRAGHPRRRPPGADPAVEQLVLLRALRQRRRLRRHDAGARRPTDPLDRYLLAKCRQYVETDDRAAGRLRDRQRLRLDADVPRRADQLVHPPLARAVLGHRRRRRAVAGRPSTRSTPCSRSSAGSPRRCCR